jgi:hypothetical protein
LSKFSMFSVSILILDGVSSSKERFFRLADSSLFVLSLGSLFIFNIFI